MDMTPLIRKFLANAATQAEQQLVLDWIEAHPGYKAEFENLKSLWSKETLTRTATNDADGFQKIRDGIKARLRKKRQRRFLLLATALLFAALLLCFLFVFPTNDALVFENTPLSSVTKTIQSEFDIRLEIENMELLSCSFNGMFYRTNEPLEVVAAVANATGATYQRISEKEYKIIGGSCD